MNRPLYAQVPTTMTLDPDLTITDHLIYQCLDILAGSRGWWYGFQHEIVEKATYRLNTSQEKPELPIILSLRSINRAVNKLREKGYISTEQQGLKMNNCLKYHIIFRERKRKIL